MNDPQASVAFSSNVEEPRIPRVRGRCIFLTMVAWMDKVKPKKLEEMKREAAALSR